MHISLARLKTTKYFNHHALSCLFDKEYFTSEFATMIDRPWWRVGKTHNRRFEEEKTILRRKDGIEYRIPGSSSSQTIKEFAAGIDREQPMTVEFLPGQIWVTYNLDRRTWEEHFIFNSNNIPELVKYNYIHIEKYLIHDPIKPKQVGWNYALLEPLL